MVNQQAHEAAFWQALYNTTTRSEFDSQSDEPSTVCLKQQQHLKQDVSKQQSKQQQQQIDNDMKTPSGFDLIGVGDNVSFSSFLSSGGPAGSGDVGSESSQSSSSHDRPTPLPPFECSTLADIEFLPTETGDDDSTVVGAATASSRASTLKKTKARSDEATSPQPQSQQPGDPGYKPLRAGLRNRNRKVVTKFDDDSDNEPPKPKPVKRKRHPPTKIDPENFGLEGSNRQERPLPPDLDEKQTRRILRNRASAERSRLRRLCKITALEQENARLRAEMELRQKEAGQDDLERENKQLKAELQLMRDRVQTLTAILSKRNGR